MNFVKSILSSGCVLLCALPLTAHADEFIGLYYPSATKAPSSCNRIEQGLHPNGMIIENGMLYREESVCKLLQPRKTESGTEFLSECELEGEPVRELMTFKKLPTGLSIATSDGNHLWTQCTNADAENNASSRWVSGYAQGVSETKITNAKGGSVTFVCGEGTSEPLVSIYLKNVQASSGPVAIAVDGKAYNFKATDGEVTIDTKCANCMENYGALMQSIFNGRKMTILPSVGEPSSFLINGAKDAFYGEICE